MRRAGFNSVMNGCSSLASKRGKPRNFCGAWPYNYECSEKGEHRPVLLEEVLEHLRIVKGGIYVDCTFGRGGHDRAVLSKLDERGGLLAIDKDPEAVEAARDLHEHDPRFTIERGSFTMLERLAERSGISGKVNGILFDLGISSPQLEVPARGFSFLHEGPLDMRMDPTAGKSAAEWLATAHQEEIAEIMWRFGEERFAKRIARAIVEARRTTPITTTRQLAAIVARASPTQQRIHPATRCFQAIRIFLNQELAELSMALPQAVRVLAPGGRLLGISFHSLEDRIVKRFMRDQARGGDYRVATPAEKRYPTLRLIGKFRASRWEVMSNPRARSALLRVAERLA